jgi:serine kinase of HPr protein (carbohydrate metabolism regulator)|tara:strand:- start:247 stop:678 length:432 start_codon:yes stop_codon:yes gene_type:complete
MKQVHATTLQLDGKGVMLCGPSSSGKSDLGLRLIENGALLVADDRTNLSLDQNMVLASSPAEISGKIEVRGVGIINLKVIEKVQLALVVDLIEAVVVQRMPSEEKIDLLGIKLPLIRLYAFEASAPAKIRAALMYHVQKKSIL